MTLPSRVRLFQIAGFGFLLACYALSSIEIIDLTTSGADLGRHLKNGELLLSPAVPAGTVSKLLHTNFYSYSQPDFEFINHHWLSDIAFFLAWKSGGFAGLNAFYIFLGVLTFALFLRIAQRAVGLWIAAAVALAVMPILRARPSVRPEIFTLLLCGVFFWLLWKHHNGRVSWRWLLLLPVLEVLWVNLHLGFCLGPAFIAAFMLADLFARPQRVTRWLGILSLTLLATVINPSGIRGAIYPLTVWSNYGLSVSENHSVPYCERQGYPGEYLLIKLTLIALFLSFILAVSRSRLFPVALFVLAALTSALAWLAVRNQTLLALFSVAAVAINLDLAGVGKLSARLRTSAVPVLGLIIAGGICYNIWKLSERAETIDLGLKPGTAAAAELLRDSRLEGPMLNNFNIGGYLIYYLFPQYRVFVDSRPEAYPSAFLQEKYIDPLHDEKTWVQLLDQYRFNVIFFSAASTWENAFVDRRLADPEWASVFSDSATIILVRRTSANQSFILAHSPTSTSK